MTPIKSFLQRFFVDQLCSERCAEINFLSTDIQINVNEGTSHMVKYNTVVQWV